MAESSLSGTSERLSLTPSELSAGASSFIGLVRSEGSLALFKGFADSVCASALTAQARAVARRQVLQPGVIVGIYIVPRHNSVGFEINKINNMRRKASRPACDNLASCSTCLACSLVSSFEPFVPIAA